MSRLITRLCILVWTYLLIALAGCTKGDDDSRSRMHSESAGSSRGASSPEQNNAAEVSLPISVATNLKIQSEEGQKHIKQANIVFSASGRGVAYIAESNGDEYIIHNGKRGNPGSEITHLVISPDGQQVAYGRKLGSYQSMIINGVASKLYNDIYDAVYSPDSKHVAYLAVEKGGLTYVVLDGKPIHGVQEIVSAAFLFSHDSKQLIYHVRPNGGTDAYLVLYDITTGKKTAKPCLDTAIVMNKKRDRIAAVVKEGDKQNVIVFAVSSPDNIIKKSASYDMIHDLSLSVDGESLAFAAVRGDKSFIVVNGKEELLPSDLGISSPPIIRTDGSGAGIVMESFERYNKYYVFHQTAQKNAKDKHYGMVKEPVYGPHGNVAFVAMTANKYFIVINGNEGPGFDSVVEPLFSPDGTKLVYRARDGSKRMVVVTDAEGKLHKRHTGYEMVFPVAIEADGKSIGYGVKEGDRFIFKVERL